MTPGEGGVPRGDHGRVSVIGLGSMGSAIAAALVRAGFMVSVFNRTRAATEGLVEIGGVEAPSAAAAIAASPLSIVCVSHYGAVEELLSSDGVAEALAGRTLVNITTGTPAQAREVERRVVAASGDYLDGNIGCYPSAIGSDETGTTYSGPPAVHRRALPVLEAIGRDQRLVGAEAGISNALQVVVTVPHIATLLSTFEGAAYAATQQVEFSTFAEQLVRSLTIVEPYLEIVARKLASGDCSVEGSSLGVYIDALETADRDMRTAGIRSALVDAMLAVMREAADEGYDSKEFGCLVDFFRARQRCEA